jgi:esterase FrsA
LEELQNLVLLHARAQNMDMVCVKQILARVATLAQQGAGGWGHEWMQEGDRLVGQSKPELAFQYYNLARFPYPSNPDMLQAHRKCVSTFAISAKNAAEKDAQLDFRRMSVNYGGQEVPFYFCRSGENRPLLLVMGGIVSIKEQWQAFLWAGKRLGVSVLVAEMPGVGENPLPYDEHASALLSCLIDAVKDLARVEHTHLVAMSFSGNLALRQATRDKRIRAISSVGAPVQNFFTDARWWENVPQTTKVTLAHLCRVAPEQVFAHIGCFALSEAELAQVNIPVYYVQSLHDEIIPASEAALLQKCLPQLTLRQYPDVHGSPNHMADLQKFVPMTVLKEAGTNPVALMVLKLILGVAGLKRKLKGAA